MARFEPTRVLMTRSNSTPPITASNARAAAAPDPTDAVEASVADTLGLGVTDALGPARDPGTADG